MTGGGVKGSEAPVAPESRLWKLHARPATRLRSIQARGHAPDGRFDPATRRFDPATHHWPPIVQASKGRQTDSVTFFPVLLPAFAIFLPTPPCHLFEPPHNIDMPPYPTRFGCARDVPLSDERCAPFGNPHSPTPAFVKQYRCSIMRPRFCSHN